jgi:hypothetical protein
MVNKRFFTSLQKPNQNWLISVALSHEMSHASCLNIKTYTKVGCDPWRRILDLLVAICSLIELPRKTLNYLRNASKWFRSEN